MTIDWPKVLPVLVSIAIIIAVAILRQYSKAFAAIAATMPINIPLGIWIVASGDDSQAALSSFTQAVAENMVPTMIFALVAYLLAKAGFGLVPMIVGGYIAWGLSISVVFWLRSHSAPA